MDRQTLEEHGPSLSSCFRPPPPLFYTHTHAHACTHVNTGPESGGKSGSAELRLEYWNKWMEVEWGRFFHVRRHEAYNPTAAGAQVWRYFLKKLLVVATDRTHTSAGDARGVCLVFGAAWTSSYDWKCFSVNMVPRGPSSCSLTFPHV